jgi:hypothetical protein
MFDVYTGTALIVALLLLWRLSRCAHAWELVDKTELPSACEVWSKTDPKGITYYPSDLPRLTAKTVILALRCPKCGAAKIWKTTSKVN